MRGPRRGRGIVGWMGKRREERSPRVDVHVGREGSSSQAMGERRIDEGGRRKESIKDLG